MCIRRLIDLKIAVKFRIEFSAPSSSGRRLHGGSILRPTFRRFVIPDAYFTSGAVDSFKKKIFWMIGPQCIGGFIGFMATKGFMTNVLGYAGF